MTNALRGQQIIYLPPAAGQNQNHPARRTGFIDRVENNGDIYCWFWRKDETNKTFNTVEGQSPTLITEGFVLSGVTVEQKYVDHWITKIYGQNNE